MVLGPAAPDPPMPEPTDREPTPSGDRARTGARAVERAATLLACFADHGAELSLARLAQASGFPKSTTFRIAEAMTRGGLIERDDAARGYRVSPLGAALGRQVLTRLGFDAVLPHLYVLAAGLELTVSLGVPRHDDVVVVFTARPPTAAADDAAPRVRWSFDDGAMGLVAAAYASPSRAGDAARTQVRRQGFATATSHDGSRHSLAVPLLEGRRAVGVLGVELAVRAATDVDARAARSLPAMRAAARRIGDALRDRTRAATA
jgi:DNA-binding IclR family transcriptional regulator